MTDTNAADEFGHVYEATPEPEPRETISRKWQDFDIVFDPRSFDFRVPGLDESAYHPTKYPSWQAARDAIDEHYKTEAANAKKAAALSIELMTAEGKPVVVTGINRATGSVSVVPYGSSISPIRTHDGNLYPRAPWIVEALAEAKRLQTALYAVKDKISKIEITGKRAGHYGGGKISARGFAHYLDNLTKEVAAAELAAEQMRPDKDTQS